jgi:hypothetical protein
MQVITKHITAYDALELLDHAPDAAEAARERHATSMWGTGEGEGFVEDTFSLELAIIAPSLAHARLRWSLAGMQGDGVSFDAAPSGLINEFTFDELGVDLPGQISPSAFSIVRNDSRYTHEYTFSVEFDTYFDDYDEDDLALGEQTAERLTDAMRGLCGTLEQVGHEAIEALESMETFIDYAMNVELLFDSSGKIVA